MTQTEALTILKTGANVFLTGEPGSGKTHTVNQFVQWLRENGIEPAITASTGIAATHIGGLTIHSWSGIGIKKYLTKYDLDSIAQNKRIVSRVGDAHILIIDEISMLSAATLGMVDAVCREIRANREPFGGLQVVLVGDFFQLPPIVTRTDAAEDQASLMDDLESQPNYFAFGAPVWQTLKPIVCYLSEQHRQEDAAFLDLLSALRRGEIDETHRELLRSRTGARQKKGVTELYSHNLDVDRINNAELAKIPGIEKSFSMDSDGPKPLVEALARGCLSPDTLKLKVGARVMFTKNDVTNFRYANGTIGEVSGFSGESGFPLVVTKSGRIVDVEPADWSLTDGGKVLAKISQIPLRLAWAITVHKSQGMSLDAAHMDLSDTFEYGQGYVALSRVRTLAGLSLAGINERALEIHPHVREHDMRFREASEAAREAFAATSPAELETMHDNFVRACGGKKGSPFTPKKKTAKIPTEDVTLSYVLKRMPVVSIAGARRLTNDTIIDHIEKLVARKKLDPLRDIAHLKPKPERFEKIKKAFEVVARKENKLLLSPARALLGDSFTYNELRLARLFLTR